jgi:hypothetical protein
MHARTLVALAVTLAGAAGCPKPRGDAAHQRPAPGTAPTMDEAAVMRPDSFCPYVSADGPSMVCIDISSTGRIGAVVLDVGARTRRAIPLVDVEGFDPCGGSEGVRTVRDDGFATLNRELASRVYQPAEVLLAYDPDPEEDGGDPPPAPPPHVAGAATISLAVGDDRVLTLTNGGQVVETLRPHWYPVTLVAVGDHHVGVVSHHRIQVWDLAARPPSCAASPRCPSHYPLARSYLGAICDDAFGDQNEDYPWRIADDQASGALAADDFAILAAAYGALAGELFADQGLRDFFHGAGADRWLPAACFGRFASMRALPEHRRWERDRVSRGARGLPLDGDE